MKHLFAIVFALCAARATAQSPSAIVCADGDIYYQEVIQCPSMSTSEIREMIKQCGTVRLSSQFIVDTDERIVATVAEMKSHSNELSWYRRMIDDFIIGWCARYRGRVIYEIRDGRYRVSLLDVEFRIPDTKLLGDYTFIKDLIYNNKGELRKRYNDKIAEALTHTFRSELAPTSFDKTDASDDW